MPTEQETAQELYDKLKPEAMAVFKDHIVSRTPPELQDEMLAIVQEDMGTGTPPAALPPEIEWAPQIAQVDEQLQCTEGIWFNDPTSKTFQWKLDGANAGTGAQVYFIVAADVGKTATCDVTAINAAGQATSTSNEVVVAEPVGQRAKTGATPPRR